MCAGGEDVNGGACGNQLCLLQCCAHETMRKLTALVSQCASGGDYVTDIAHKKRTE